MGLFARMFGRTSARTVGALTLHASGLVEVVGESHRQETLKRLAARATDATPLLADLSGRARKVAEAEPHRRWFRAALIREKDNKYDRNAVAVYSDGVGLVGFLNPDDAIDYQPVFAALEKDGCKVGSCPAYLIGGEPGKPSYGVVLCLSSPERIIRDLAETPLSGSTRMARRSASPTVGSTGRSAGQ